MDNQSLVFYIIKRLVISLIIAVVLLFGTNLAWLIVFSRYDFETVNVDQATESGGNCMYNSKGEMIYGKVEGENEVIP